MSIRGNLALRQDAPAPLRAADFRSDVDPIWCPGCGHHALLLAVTTALAELGVAHENVAFVSGIGCSSRIPAYTNVYGFHGVHGRALPTATGVKLARPDLTVIAAGGDGDGLSIGGNHFTHACRRNVDMTYIVMDNQVYGMTKGQASPTTSADWSGSKLTPHGTGISPVEPARLALVAGANFIARGFSGQPKEVAKLIVAAVRHPGFSFVHVLSPCVTYRKEQREWKHAVHPSLDAAPPSRMDEAMHRLADDDGFTTGILFSGDRPAFAPDRQQRMAIGSFDAQFAA
ncbi:2-oxoacid:ferredoxin oxidoreductase subunit beta [Siculibacillus lacustris]|uniref:2-oxoacid:ferredoxin oxidoreductase subunit beta n=1 Tax=Siculibacillus lacustris TaxID=1549641 RepID=A0A4Q9VMH2_9HYPH|nr:2-oxoacid:ferredoxin oxidoreductase subunit beta [Siculibacillus lacustris]TBW36791.1 2-oxoacid:ferredoxin oxidoreductase subunit beta [Siculibacillus lacustris]